MKTNRLNLFLLVLIVAIVFSVGGYLAGRQAALAEILNIPIGLPFATMNPVVLTPGGVETMSANIRNALDTPVATADG